MPSKTKIIGFLTTILFSASITAAEGDVETVVAETDTATETVSAQDQERATAPVSKLYMEINKLEQRDDLCVAYVRFSNQTNTEFSELKSELFAFNKDEIITAHFLADFQKVMANKTVVKLVPMKDTKCSEVGSILLNRMTSCTSAGDEVANCMSMIRTGTKSSVRLFK